MAEENFTLIIITALGIIQATLTVFLARKNNEAVAEKDKASALESAGTYYANLLDRMEKRLLAATNREETMMSRIEALEKKCEKYEELIEKYESIIESLE